jgi:aryl-alcohol dehydrogenase-like predicted oxidoreductase
VTRDAAPDSDERLYRVVEALDAVAGETGKTVPQIALNWLLGRPTVSTIVIGARTEEQLRQNIGAVGWSLTPAQVAALRSREEARDPRLPVLAPGTVRREKPAARGGSVLPPTQRRS